MGGGHATVYLAVAESLSAGWNLRNRDSPEAPGAALAWRRGEEPEVTGMRTKKRLTEPVPPAGRAFARWSPVATVAAKPYVAGVVGGSGSLRLIREDTLASARSRRPPLHDLESLGDVGVGQRWEAAEAGVELAEDHRGRNRHFVRTKTDTQNWQGRWAMVFLRHPPLCQPGGCPGRWAETVLTSLGRGAVFPHPAACCSGTPPSQVGGPSSVPRHGSQQHFRGSPKSRGESSGKSSQAASQERGEPEQDVS